MRSWPLSGHSHHPSNSCLSINKSSTGPRSIGLSVSWTPYDISSTLSTGFYTHEERADKSQQTESPSHSRVQIREQNPGVKWCRVFFFPDSVALSLIYRQSQRSVAVQ